MAESTKIRPLARLLDKSDAALWAIGPEGRLVFLSAAMADWLMVPPETLVGRTAVAGTRLSDDPLDYLAASLAPPPGVTSPDAPGVASLQVQPALPPARGPAVSPAMHAERARRVEPRRAWFLRVGQGDTAFVLALTGAFPPMPQPDADVQAAIELREQLDRWRRHHQRVASDLLVGRSRAAQRLQSQVQLACAVRGDLIIHAPPGCFADSLASEVHSQAAPGEPLVAVQGPLMDAELLDASLSMLLHHLSESETAQVTVVLQEAEQTPPEAQSRLAEHLRHWGARLRLIAIAAPAVEVLADAPEEPGPEVLQEVEPPRGVHRALADRLCGLSITLPPLARRVEDVPMIAAAMLQRRRAAGQGRADRFARAALDALVLYPWPENLLELDQAVGHAARRCGGESVQLEHLPLAVRSYRPNATLPAEKQQIDLDRTVAAYERRLIERALQAADGNRSEAARRLNISRARLLRKLETGGS